MAAKEPSHPHLDLAISRFIEDFQNIIREHVQRAVREALSARRGGARGRRAAKGRAPSASAERGAKSARARSNAAQLSLF